MLAGGKDGRGVHLIPMSSQSSTEAGGVRKRRVPPVLAAVPPAIDRLQHLGKRLQLEYSAFLQYYMETLAAATAEVEEELAAGMSQHDYEHIAVAVEALSDAVVESNRQVASVMKENADEVAGVAFKVPSLVPERGATRTPRRADLGAANGHRGGQRGRFSREFCAPY